MGPKERKREEQTVWKHVLIELEKAYDRNRKKKGKLPGGAPKKHKTHVWGKKKKKTPAKKKQRETPGQNGGEEPGSGPREKLKKSGFSPPFLNYYP